MLKRVCTGMLNHCAYSTASSTEVSRTITNAQCEKHNQSIPTYAQIKSDPEKQKEVAKMFEYYATDPTHQKEAEEAAALGLRLLRESSVPK